MWDETTCDNLAGIVGESWRGVMAHAPLTDATPTEESK